MVLTRYAEAIIIIEGGRTRPTRRYDAKGPHTEPYSEALWYMLVIEDIKSMQKSNDK